MKEGIHPIVEVIHMTWNAAIGNYDDDDDDC
mgnify:CR=1 FL=1